LIELFNQEDTVLRSTAVFLTALLTIAPLQTGVAFAEGFKPLDFREHEKEITRAFGSDFKVSVKDSVISVDDFQGQTIKLLFDRQNADLGQKERPMQLIFCSWKKLAISRDCLVRSTSYPQVQ
jgi:hypothetical protein